MNLIYHEVPALQKWLQIHKRSLNIWFKFRHDTWTGWKIWAYLFHYAFYLRKIPWFVLWGKTYEIFYIHWTYFSVRMWRVGDLGSNFHFFYGQAHSKAGKMHITFLAMQMVFSTELWVEAAANPTKYCQTNGWYNVWESYCYDFYKANL